MTFSSGTHLSHYEILAPVGVGGMGEGLAVSRDSSRSFIVQGVEQPETNVIHVMIPATRSR